MQVNFHQVAVSVENQANCSQCQANFQDRQNIWAHNNQAGEAVCHIHEKCLRTWAQCRLFCPTCEAETDPSSIPFSWRERQVRFLRENILGAIMGGVAMFGSCVGILSTISESMDEIFPNLTVPLPCFIFSLPVSKLSSKRPGTHPASRGHSGM